MFSIFGTGCSDDDPVGPGDGIPVDTSSLQFVNFHSTGYHDDGEVKTGLTMQWTLAFESTTGRDCRVQFYRLLDQDSTEVHRRDNPTIKYIEDGSELSDKDVWVPIDGPTSSGDYTFIVYYETGRLMDTGEGGTEWNGPLSTGAVSRDFSIDPAP
ncbi:MAG: hypothetical protein GF341_01885 [candidate division Zixibacteria bacterium]|nr:hypothetical protein [candidate division Zixibacteria bacterium]